MKLIQKLARKLHPHLVIPEEVLKHIDSLQKINVVYKTDVVTDRYWRFRDEVSDYMHRYNLWYVTTEVPSLSPLPREYVETTKNVLLQRVLWGQNDEAYYYGTMSFVKFRKRWVYVGENGVCTELQRLPTLEESYGQYTNKEGEKVQGNFEEYIDILYTYD